MYVRVASSFIRSRALVNALFCNRKAIEAVLVKFVKS